MDNTGRETELAEKVATLKYYEACKLPKFKACLDRLLNRAEFDWLFSTHSVDAAELLPFIEKAVKEGNSVLIEHEWNGYVVILWKD